jgi:hypothetical protein
MVSRSAVVITAPILHRATRAVMREAIPLRLQRLRRLRRRAPRPTVRELRRDHIECLLEVITRPEYRAGGLNRLARYGIITWAQLEAGIEYAELIWDYHWVIEAPQPRTRPSKIERAKLAAIPREDEGRSRLELEDFPSGFQSELQCRDGSSPSRQWGVTNPRAKAALRAWLERKVAEYLSGGGKITVCPGGQRTIAIRRRDPHQYVPGTWRSGYAPFRHNGAQLYCPSPDAADPDTEAGRYVVNEERKLRRRLDRAPAGLRNAGERAERFVRRLCEDDVLDMTPAEITDLRDGLEALRKSLHHAANKPMDDAPRIKRERRARKTQERRRHVKHAA